jgi:hypothetical protein
MQEVGADLVLDALSGAAILAVHMTNAKQVWRRRCESNGLIRTRRCTPGS